MAAGLRRLFTRATAGEAARIAEILRRETVGGTLLVGAALVALVWINSPVGDSYVDLRDTRVGPGLLHLDLSLGTWAADGLLAIFFFVAGLELKREFVAGDLRDPRRARCRSSPPSAASPSRRSSTSSSMRPPTATRTVGRSPPPPTSRSRSRYSRSSGATCRRRCGRSC